LRWKRLLSWRRTPVVAALLLFLLLRQVSRIPAQADPNLGACAACPSGTLAGTSRHHYAICYLVFDGVRVGAASLMDDGAFERRIGVAYLVETRVLSGGWAATTETVGGEFEIHWRGGGPALEDREILRGTCARFAARDSDEYMFLRVGEFWARDSIADRTIWKGYLENAGVGLLALVLGDSLLGVGAWWRAIQEWDRRKRERVAAEEARRRGLCRRCGYSLEGLPGRRCPECGTEW
jgi:hypothetical protein